MCRFFYLGMTCNLGLGEWLKDVVLVVAHMLGIS